MSRRWDNNRERPYPPRHQARGGFGDRTTRHKGGPSHRFGGSTNMLHHQHGGGGRGGGSAGWRNDYYRGYNQRGASRGHTTGHYRSVAQNQSVRPPPPRSRYPAQPRQPPTTMNAAPAVSIHLQGVGATAQEHEMPSTMNPQINDDKAPEPKKAFVDMGYKEQLKAMIPHTEQDKVAFIRKLPAESLSPKTLSGKKAHSIQWKDDKKKVAAKLAEQMKAKWPKHNSASIQDPNLSDYDSEDDDLDEPNDQHLEQYILALPTCHLMSIGFDFTGMCFCPCHHQQTKQWRELAGIAIQGGECTAKSRFDTPNALVDHLRTMKEGCEFHKYTLLYLKELYNL